MFEYDFRYYIYFLNDLDISMGTAMTMNTRIEMIVCIAKDTIVWNDGPSR